MKSKLQKVLRVATLGIAAAGILSVGQNAAAMGHEDVEINASVGIANMYLWRGLDVSGTSATAAVSGSVSVAVKPAGFYFGIWGSSGWEGAGAEYDLFIGWGRQWGLFGFDISAWNYVYSECDCEYENVGKLSDVVMSFSFTPEGKGWGFGLGYYQNVTDSANQFYYTGSVDLWMFSILVGHSNGAYEWDADNAEDLVKKGAAWIAAAEADYTHANVTYSYNKNLNFTISQIFQQGDDGEYNERPKFVVSYNLPINLM